MTRASFLYEKVLRLLRDRYPQPVTGLQLTAMLEAQGESAPPSLVFRAIRRLIELGKARKVHIASGYAPVGNPDAIVLWCRACGEISEVECAAAADRLRRAAAAAGLAEPRHVVEVPGICGKCAGR
jgi:Fur family zinc uptake transcriptional regulator